MLWNLTLLDQIFLDSGLGWEELERTRKLEQIDDFSSQVIWFRNQGNQKKSPLLTEIRLLIFILLSLLCTLTLSLRWGSL